MSGGFNNMLHFVGVVEDIYDKTNAGRVRVRAFGIHPPRVSSDIEDSVPTQDLPWATVLDGTYGVSPVIPSVGDWVFGFFVDGREAQQPMIMGRLPGMHLNVPGGTGEAGEDGYLPPESIKNYGKPELHRYQGGEDLDKGQTLNQFSSQTFDIAQALTEDTFDEPTIAPPENNYNNRVFASKSGDNFIVMGDDSQDATSDYILMSHSSGSVFQIDPSGTIFVKAFGDQYNTTEGVLSTYVKGSSHHNVQEDWSLKVETGSGKVYVHGDLDIECENFNVTARSKMNLHAGVKTNISAPGISMLATADDINVGAKKNIKIKTGTEDNGGGFYLQALYGDLHIDSYKANMFTETYHKITCNGTKAVSDQEIPYKDKGHHGIEINSPSLIHLESPSISAKSDSLISLESSGKVGIKGGSAIDLSAGTVGIDDIVTMANGVGSSGADNAVSTVESTRGDNVANNSAYVSTTEVASVVSPGELPGSKAKIPPVVKRLVSYITGLLD